MKVNLGFSIVIILVSFGQSFEAVLLTQKRILHQFIYYVEKISQVTLTGNGSFTSTLFITLSIIVETTFFILSPTRFFLLIIQLNTYL